MSQATDVKKDRRYTKDHEWAITKDGNVVVGITAFAVDQLGDVTLINWDVAAGDRVETGQVFGTIESVKSVSDLYAPISGRVVSINPALKDSPEDVNSDPYNKGWMIELEANDKGEIEELMDATAYTAHVAAQ